MLGKISFSSIAVCAVCKGAPGLMISASGMIGRNDFKQIDRVDDVWSVGAEVEWTINRNLVLMLAYSHSVRKADFRRFLSYSGNVVMFGLEARY